MALADVDDQPTQVLLQAGVPAEKLCDTLYVTSGCSLSAGSTRRLPERPAPSPTCSGPASARVRPGSTTDSLSSGFLMSLAGGQMLAYGDCVVLPDPTDVQLLAGGGRYPGHLRAPDRDRACGRDALLQHPRQRGSPGGHEGTTRDRAGQGGAPDLLVDGELQLGSDHVAAVGAASAVHSEVAGRANMVILPDLGGGNIGYMITERLAWATAIGPDPPGRGQATQRPVPRMQHDRHRHRGADERHAVN